MTEFLRREQPENDFPTVPEHLGYSECLGYCLNLNVAKILSVNKKLLIVYRYSTSNYTGM